MNDTPMCYEAQQIQRVLDETVRRHPEDHDDLLKMQIHGTWDTKWLSLTRGDVEAIRDLLQERILAREPRVYRYKTELPVGSVIVLGHPSNKVYAVKYTESYENGPDSKEREDLGFRYLYSGRTLGYDDIRKSEWNIISVPQHKYNGDED